MSDARWLEVEADVAASVRHFSRCVALWHSGGLVRDDGDPYWPQMGLMHAMQSGHSSLEAALVRILDLVQETQPTGAQWHADLITRVSRPFEGRPAVLTPALARAAGETRRFRDVAMRGYDGFERDRAAPAIDAAGVIAAGLPGAAEAFRLALDP